MHKVKILRFSIFCIFIIMASFIQALLAQKPDFILIVEADTYISGANDGNHAHGHPDSAKRNINDFEHLVIKNEGEPMAGNSFYREVMLRFNLSTVTDEIGTVRLQLWPLGKSETAPDTIKYGCYLIPDDNWNEETVTWNTAPFPDYDIKIGGNFMTTIHQTGFYLRNGEKIERTHYGGIIGGDLNVQIVEKERTGDHKLSLDVFAYTKKMVWSDPDTWSAFVSKDSVCADSLKPRLFIWKKGNEPTEVEEHLSPNDLNYRLEANYPNPFNPSTTIGYTLKKNGEVTLSIYNILGQKIWTFKNLPNTVGQHQVRWNGQMTNGKQAPAGIYFYQLQTEKFTAVRKMILTE